MKIRIADIVQDSIVDGTGMRLAIFVQGCPHHCNGCHNPGTHDFTGGEEMDVEQIIAMMDSNPMLDGITLSGGEPFCQCAACLEIAKAAHERGLNVWAYSGWMFYDLALDAGRRTLLEEVDVLVDGRYIKDLRTLELPFRGSSNQRLVNVKRSLKEGHVVEWA